MVRFIKFAFATLILIATRQTLAQHGNFVPGSGTILEQVGDDFENPNWVYQFNNPKSTEEINELQNQPLGKSANGRWFEGVKRGQPDQVERVETPSGGLPGSTGAMLLRSLQTGVPGRPSHKMQQEDFIMNVQYRTGGPVPISQNPSVTTRVYLPPTDQWERRSGPQFAFRVALETTKTVPRKVLVFATKEEDETYWPGLFVCMDTKEQTKKDHDHVYFRIRADRKGGDMLGPDLPTMGWWTLGISVSANGAIHYYARPGVENLTQDDYITTQYPYSYRAERFRAAFFNVINGDNGRTWSTSWIIDDTRVYLGTNPDQKLAHSKTSTQKRAKLTSAASGSRMPSPPPLNNSKAVPDANQPAGSAEQPASPNDTDDLNDLDLDYYR